MGRGCHAVSLALVCTGLAACGSSAGDSAPRVAAATATVGCAEGGTSSASTSATWQPTSLVSGPLTLGYVWQYADQPADAFDPTREQLQRIARAGSGATARERRLARRTRARAAPASYGVHEVLVRVDAGEAATLAVAPRQRAAVALVYTRAARNRERRGAAGAYTVADGDPAVTFRACERRATEFLGGIVVARARCVALTVSGAGQARPARLRIPFGQDSCAPHRVRGKHLLSRPPYLGVACPTANSIACDRVGLAVWLKRAAERVTATINGRPLRLHAGRTDGRGAWYRGYLQPAGLLDGPLKVTPDRGRHHWEGRHAKTAWVRIDIRRAGGRRHVAALRVPLSAGWG